MKRIPVIIASMDHRGALQMVYLEDTSDDHKEVDIQELSKKHPGCTFVLNTLHIYQSIEEFTHMETRRQVWDKLNAAERIAMGMTRRP